MYIGKRSAIRAVCFALALVAVMGEFIHMERDRHLTYQAFTDNGYAHAFSELVDSMGELNTALQKCRYASTPPMVNSCCGEIMTSSVSAQTAMGQLPFSSYELDVSSCFAARAADLAACLSKSSARGDPLSAEELETLEAYADTADQMHIALTDLFDRVDDGTVSLHSSDGDADSLTLSDGFYALEQKLRALPDFCYDGALSPDITERKAKLIENTELISPEEAVDKASDFLGISPDRLRIASRHEGALPIYSVSYLNGSRYIDITRQGGQVVYFMDSYTPGSPVYSESDAGKIAGSFLKNMGYGSMTLLDGSDLGEFGSFVFAPETDGVLCYPDYVRVSVALDTGRITGLEAVNYVKYHYARQIPDVEISEEEAAGTLSDRLEIKSHRLAVILSDGFNELLCHEFRCKAADGTELLVYINAVTGIEEEIKPLDMGKDYNVV